MFFQNFDVTSILSYSFAFILVVLLVEMLLNSIDKRVTRWR